MAAPFVGRSVELTLVAAGLRGLSSERSILVLGDAGIGKSRLLAEAVQQAVGAGGLALQGSCLPLTETLPLLPVVEALRGYARRDRGRGLHEVLSLQPRYVRLEIGRLVPEYSPAPSGGDEADGGYDEGWRRERLFAAIQAFLGGMADRGQVALVVEDLHWADPSTLDLLRFLFSNGDPVPMAVSCRWDEPLSGSAFQDWLAAARTAPGVTEIALQPLTPGDAALQAAGLIGHQPTGATLAALYRRTGGNPFFTEQLIAAGLAQEGRPAMDATTPPGLAALLGARVRRSSPQARHVLAALAVASRPLDEETLAAISELDSVAVEDALIELIEARLVATNDKNQYQPRHQLLADVVASELLGGRRRALHARFAQSLAARGGPEYAGEIAAHWLAADAPDEALAWSATAGTTAERMYAYAEAARHWEQVIELWDTAQTKPTGLRLGTAYLHALGDLYYCSDRKRGNALTEQGLTRLGDGSADDARYDRATLLGYAATFRRVDSLEAALLASEESVQLFSTLPPSHERASSLGSYGKLLDVAGRLDDALRAMSEGLADARARGSRDDEAAALTDLTTHELFSGDWDRGRAHLTEAKELLRGSRDVESRLMVVVLETDVLLRTGRLPEAIDAGMKGLQEVDSQGGGTFPMASTIRANVAEALLELGRVRETGLIIDPLTSGDPTQYDRDIYDLRVRLDVARGHLDEASTLLTAIRTVVPDNPNVLIHLEEDALEIALWRQQPTDAIALPMTLLIRIAELPAGRDAGRLLSLTVRACAERAQTARATSDAERLHDALEAIDELTARHADLRYDPFADHPGVVTASAEHATWLAERARAVGTDGADLWAHAADSWETLQRPHRTAYSLWRLAEALLLVRKPEQAALALRRASLLAETMMPLRGAIAALGRRGRIGLGPAEEPSHTDPESPQILYGLTEREQDVLRLLARGLTNAEIGNALFMSPKTASVHVTHILRKLGVAGRVQAAMLAERAGIIDDDTARSDRSDPS